MAAAGLTSGPESDVDWHAVLSARTTPPPFFFAGPSRTLMALDEGQALRDVVGDTRQLLAAVHDRLNHAEVGALVVGGIPFDSASPTELLFPQTFRHSGRWQAKLPVAKDSKALTPALLQRLSDGREGREYMCGVERALAAIRANDLVKVVLSRKTTFATACPVHIPDVLGTLRAKNPHGFTFSLQQQLGGKPTSWVGSSPELLVSRRGSLVVCAPLAGSVPRALDRAEDQARAERLLKSAKDLHEHQLVVRQILQDLAPFTSELKAEAHPVLTRTSALWHLSTRIQGQLKTPAASCLTLALALHPTPAVCGLPKARAARFIQDFERFERGLFTGTLGYMNAAGDGDWIVTIRCARIARDELSVFAGAGIVHSSLPEGELLETEAKMRTVLEALNLGVSA